MRPLRFLFAARLLQLLWLLLTSHQCQLVDDEISLGKVNVIWSNPAESTQLPFWYSSGFTMMWLLQCMGHPRPPCHLLMLQGVTFAHKGLAPSGLSSKFIISKNLIIFTIQGTHSTFAIGGVLCSADSLW